mmetsp:Transcript_106471/g.237666  ORF Transcript_106471/g.237666 Transcript_106471/m.237666 type:complete len:87 (+) Transcript_106471:60-320(+)
MSNTRVICIQKTKALIKFHATNMFIKLCCLQREVITINGPICKIPISLLHQTNGPIPMGVSVVCSKFSDKHWSMLTNVTIERVAAS